MKVTTVRFSEDLWRTIATEAEIAGVSASAFIREAALARAASAAGARGELPFPTFEGTLEQARAVAASADERELEAALAALSRALSSSLRSDSRALRAESEQARRNAGAMRRRGSKRRRSDQPDPSLD